MNDQPAALVASYARLKTLADGTVQLTINVEPKDAQLAFAVCDKPGASLVVMRMTDKAALAHDRRQQEHAPGTPSPAPEKKPLSLASKVAMTCASPTFHDWLRRHHSDRWLAAFHNARKRGGGGQPRHADAAAEYVRRACGVSSRSEIVLGSDAAAIWGTISADFEHWQRFGERAA